LGIITVFCLPHTLRIRLLKGTIGLELLEQVPDVDAVLIAMSGGGLASGIAVAIKSLRPSCRIYLVAPPGEQ